MLIECHSWQISSDAGKRTPICSECIFSVVIEVA